MLQRRGATSIVGEILRLGSAGRTEIMYSVNLSYKQLERYLEFLEGRGLLRRETEGHRVPHYGPTEQGRQLLEHINKVVTTLRLDELEPH